MRFRATWMSFSLAVALASAVLIALTVTPAVSLAGAASGRDVSQMAVDAAATVDARPAGGAMEPAPVGLQVGLQMMDSHDDFWDSGWWIVMVVMMVLFWGGVIAVAVWGIRQFTRDRKRDGSALDIAKERLARGEITKEEFDRIRGDLV